MPQERENQFPYMTQESWDQARQGVPREMQAARLIVSRNTTGIPHRPYLLGDSDHAPVVKAVAEFAAKVYALLDAFDDMVTTGCDERIPDPLRDAAGSVAAAMEEFKL